MINRMTVLFRQSQIDLIGVHHGGEDVFFPIHFYRKTVGFFLKAFRKFITTMLFKIVAVDIQNHLIVNLGILLQPAKR